MEDTYLLENGRLFEGLCVVDMNNLKMAAFMMYHSYFFLHLNVANQPLTTFSNVFIKGIRFNTYHYRFAFHRNAHNH